MNIAVDEVPRKGDYYAFQAIVWHDGVLQFILTKKLTGTELAISLNRKCVKDQDDALVKLKHFTVSEAKKIYENQRYKVGDKFVGNYSPCW